MQDSDKPKNDGTDSGNADATSKETVADIEDSEKSSGGKQERSESGVASPDGALDEKPDPDGSGPM